MPHVEIVRQLVAELERVGVDPDHMVAGLTSRAEDALRALRALPDGAGPAAFLAELRSQSAPVGSSGSSGAMSDHDRSGGPSPA
jgi:hypothetical protein